MLAYAPCLQEFGIDQSMFIEFIRTCNDVIQVSPVMGIVKLAAFGAGFSPTPIISGVATAVSLGATAVVMRLRTPSEFTIIVFSAAILGC